MMIEISCEPGEVIDCVLVCRCNGWFRRCALERLARAQRLKGLLYDNLQGRYGDDGTMIP